MSLPRFIIDLANTINNLAQTQCSFKSNITTSVVTLTTNTTNNLVQTQCSFKSNIATNITALTTNL